MVNILAPEQPSGCPRETAPPLILTLSPSNFNNSILTSGTIEKASFISRIGSGSACRSIYGGVNFWGKHKVLNNSSDLYSIKLHKNISPKFNNYRDVILLIDEKEKEVSSSVGHELMNNNPFSKVRFAAANDNIINLMRILKSGDLIDFCELVESEALMLHSLMMSSNPSYILMKPETLTVIKRIQDFRKKTDIIFPIFFVATYSMKE